MSLAIRDAAHLVEAVTENRYDLFNIALFFATQALCLDDIQEDENGYFRRTGLRTTTQVTHLVLSSTTILRRKRHESVISLVIFTKHLPYVNIIEL
jgi:hypothetical protein